jgi:hypothetical protein
MPPRVSKHCPKGPRRITYSSTAVVILVLSYLPAIGALHHMKLAQVRPSNHAEIERRQDNTPFTVINNCGDDLLLGVITQGGNGPSETGFMLSPGSENNLSTSADLQGRVWAHTHCFLNSEGTGAANNSLGMACGTGDCNDLLNCQVTVRSKTKTTFALLIAVLILMLVAG